MIYVTGDTHGVFTRFRSVSFPEQKSMTKNDYVIICGDFGGVWNGNSNERNWLDWLDAKPFTTLFVDGNHENYDLLKKFPIKEWHGGNVRLVRENLIHLMRGQVYCIDGKTFFTMGGASSHDIEDGVLEPDDPDLLQKRRELDSKGALYRVNHISWWAEELPCEEEYEAAMRNLDLHNWQVDNIITHCCPSSIVDIIGEESYAHDTLTDFFDEVRNRCNFDAWFFGHYHQSQVFSEKYILLHEQIVDLYSGNARFT